MTAPAISEPEARDALVRIMHRMHDTGLNRGTSGNASIRVPGGMMVTPSGVEPGELSPDRMVFVGNDAALRPNSLVPSSEFQMHLAILHGRPDAAAVVHCHSRYATILACCNKPIEPIHYMVLSSGATRVPIAPFAVFGSTELARHVVETMGTGNACLMAHHGQVAIGRTWQRALTLAEQIEEQAALTYGALLLGGAATLSAEQLDATVERFRSYGQKPQ